MVYLWDKELTKYFKVETPIYYNNNIIEYYLIQIIIKNIKYIK